MLPTCSLVPQGSVDFEKWLKKLTVAVIGPGLDVMSDAEMMLAVEHLLRWNRVTVCVQPTSTSWLCICLFIITLMLLLSTQSDVSTCTCFSAAGLWMAIN
jgi:hypothetical protein